MSAEFERIIKSGRIAEGCRLKLGKGPGFEEYRDFGSLLALNIRPDITDLDLNGID